MLVRIIVCASTLPVYELFRHILVGRFKPRLRQADQACTKGQHQNDAECRNCSCCQQSKAATWSRRADPYDSRPRDGVLSWDDYFMSIAHLTSLRSKDPSKQVGACIVDANKIILGVGYNGFPRGCRDDMLPWSKKSDKGDYDTKFPYVVHAEANALLNKNHSDITGASIFVTLFPCNECAKLLIQAGIKEVIYFEAKPALSLEESSNLAATSGLKPDTAYAASRRLLQMAQVKIRQHRPSRSVELNFRSEPEARCPAFCGAMPASEQALLCDKQGASGGA